MATYYLSSVDGSDASDGLSWADAFATFKYAVETASAAASGPHTILVESTHSESQGSAMTTTLAGNVMVISVNRSTGALTAGASVRTNGNFALSLVGAYNLYCYGVTFGTGGSTQNTVMVMGSSDGAHYEFEACRFESGVTGSTASIKVGGDGAINNNQYFSLSNCVFKVAATGQFVQIATGFAELYGCSIDSSGSAPTSFMRIQGGATAIMEGCDFSHIGSGTLFSNLTAAHSSARIVNCKLGSGMTIKAAAATVLNKGNQSVWAFNCDAGDVHYAMYHGDAFGETIVSNTIYANDGAKYDGTNKCSWKITTTANCSFYWPYVSPWLELYHSGTSAITPALEILRDGSATAYQNDEVWGEFSYQGTSGYPTATIVSDRMTPLGTAADQATGDLNASGWTGENATAWFGKLAPASAITPAEIGYLRARVCVGEPSITVYVDPTIRGLSITQDKSRVTGSGWMETESSGSGSSGGAILLGSSGRFGVQES